MNSNTVSYKLTKNLNRGDELILPSGTFKVLGKSEQNGQILVTFYSGPSRLLNPEQKQKVKPNPNRILDNTMNPGYVKSMAKA